jgi:hypothetical protein
MFSWLKETTIFVLAAIGLVQVLRLLVQELIKLVGDWSKLRLKVIKSRQNINSKASKTINIDKKKNEGVRGNIKGENKISLDKLKD